jgi:c-di-GMP-binding flagellar brake protein YcgR
MFEHGPQTRIRRAPVRAIATVTWDGGPREVYGQVLNVSPGGCLLKTETTIEPGTRLEMSIIVISEGERAKADVEAVVRRRTEENGRQAYGLEFVALESSDKESVQWLYSQAMR